LTTAPRRGAAAWRLVPALVAACLFGVATAGDIHVPNRGWTKYKGAWFEVQYPVGFAVKPCEAGLTRTGGAPDGASFLSPDRQVEFYIYSPQWSGQPTWPKKRSGEKTVSHQVERHGTRTVTWVTYAGPRGVGSRSYVDTVDSGQNTRLVFGFAYRSGAAYKAYRPLYLRFKASVKQYGD
jgi:hypothetical protein